MLLSVTPKRFGGGHLLVAVLALLSLLLSGGTYTHAHELGFESHVHSASTMDDHGHASDCPMCKGDERPVHCGANILMIVAVGELAHPARALQTAVIRQSQRAGHLLVPDPPPPRSIPVLEM